VSPGGAGRGLTCRSAPARMAGRGRHSPVPVVVGSQFGSPEISLAALMFEQQEAGTGPERKSGQRAHSVKPSAGARR